MVSIRICTCMLSRQWHERPLIPMLKTLYSVDEYKQKQQGMIIFKVNVLMHLLTRWKFQWNASAEVNNIDLLPIGYLLGRSSIPPYITNTLTLATSISYNLLSIQKTVRETIQKPIFVKKMEWIHAQLCCHFLPWMNVNKYHVMKTLVYFLSCQALCWLCFKSCHNLICRQFYTLHTVYEMLALII